jgi:hypothetical protein
MERWKPIAGFDGYEVSDCRRVRSRRYTIGRGVSGLAKDWKMLKLDRSSRGYLSVRLSIGSKHHARKVQHLVLSAFVGPRPANKECRHLDGDSSNNRIKNLCWGTKSENERDKLTHGTSNRGQGNGRAKLSVSDVAKIRRLLANGENGIRLAREYGVSKSAIYAIRYKDTWRWLS